MSFGTAYSIKKRGKKCMAKGGDILANKAGQVSAGGNVRAAHRAFEHAKNPNASSPRIEREMGREYSAKAKDLHKEKLGAIKASAPKGELYAEGGEVESAMHGEQSDEDMLDMVGRIIAKHMFSKGGEVANDVGVAEADELPAEYDDLVLRDDMEDDSSAGNEHGDADVHDDAIDRIMLKRKKDRMPRPA